MDRMREENKALRDENDKLRDELFAAKHNRNMNEFKIHNQSSTENVKSSESFVDYKPIEKYQRAAKEANDARIGTHLKEDTFPPIEKQEQYKYQPPSMAGGMHVRTSIESAVAPSPSQDLQNRMNMDDLSNNQRSTTDPLTNFKRYLSGDQLNNKDGSQPRTGVDAQYKAIEGYKAQHAYLGNQNP